MTILPLASTGTWWDLASSGAWLDLPVLGRLPRVVVAITGAILLLALTPFLLRRYRLWHDLRVGEIQVDEGTIEKHFRRPSAFDEYGFTTTYDLRVSGTGYRVPTRVYDAAPAGGEVRLFVLPRSHTVVNLELLDWETPPEDQPTGP